MVQLDSSAKIDYWDQQREEHCHLCTRRLPEKHVYHLNAILTCYYSTMTHYFIMPFLLGNRKQYDEADAVLKYHSSQRLDLGPRCTFDWHRHWMWMQGRTNEARDKPYTTEWCCGGAKTWGLKLNVQTPHPLCM